MASVRTRSASPKSVSFSPVLERKYSAERGPSYPPELSPNEWRKYFNDFSSYLDALLADLQNSINPGRVSSPGGRTTSPSARTSSPGRTASPIGRGSSPGRLSSPGGSLSSPTSTGYGSINGSRNIGSDYAKPASPTYQNTSAIHEKSTPLKYTSTQASYASHTPSYTGQPGYGRTTGRGNLSELDTLLDDLSNARYGNYVEKNAYADRTDTYNRTNGATSPASARPTVDSLLDQLSTEVHNGRASTSPVPPSGTLPRPGTKQVTVTVQETVVEPAAPPPPQPQPSTTHRHHASSATKELDDLMASLSDFKVSACCQHVFINLECREPFHGGSFFEHEGQPYCETHYHGKRGSLCAGCHKPIAGRCITAMFRKFHPEHFVCAFCLRQLNKGTFKEQNDKPYCHACFDKLFG
ncbi:paxillin-like [Zerene cesonia]|uniref:paxillin-like n=1 Tax=Zerene cesonia TaxID=33412 RepID=UPI0018E4F010|nr:paxillin-like [Zerene cesonia]